ncbi:hypothetical protein BaRGS_00002485 [Batillaria attramentaria]|uniref:Uncharacterized protein n=1 Tax=Batillaria attramentaria TaxID=370345 RepID=A0ABD0M5D6_9CAEN
MLSTAQGKMAVSPRWNVTLTARGRKTGKSGSIVTPPSPNAATDNQSTLATNADSQSMTVTQTRRLQLWLTQFSQCNQWLVVTVRLPITVNGRNST